MNWCFIIFENTLKGAKKKACIRQGEMIGDVLLHLDTHNSVGLDGIHPRVLRELAEEVWREGVLRFDFISLYALLIWLVRNLISPSRVSFAHDSNWCDFSLSLTQDTSFLFYFLSPCPVEGTDRAAMVDTWHATRISPPQPPKDRSFLPASGRYFSYKRASKMLLLLGFGKHITLQIIPVLTFVRGWIWTLSRRLFLGKEKSILTINIHIAIVHRDSHLKDTDTSPAQSKVCVIIKGERTIGTQLLTPLKNHT